MTTQHPRAAVVTDVPGLCEHVGTDLGYTEWEQITQERVDRFADVTGDDQFIHVDPERASATPFGGTIAHGYLMLSLLPTMSRRLLRVTDAAMSVNYGLDRVRFPAPLRVGARFRARGHLASAAKVDGGVQVKIVITVEVEEGDKPVLVAESLVRHYRAPTSL